MTRVRCILVETTVPVRIRPRIETKPVKGHFLSVRYRRISTTHQKSPQANAIGYMSGDIGGINIPM
jgi:hypothetical protein